MTLDKLRSDARVDMAINKMMEAEVASQPEATDAQVREFYDKNPDKFKQDETVRASHILMRVDPKADEATKKKARAKAGDLRSRPRAARTSPSWPARTRLTAAPRRAGDLELPLARGRWSRRSTRWCSR